MRIKIDDVEFGYAQGVPILKNIDLDISGNKLVSIIGPNGVGKSTLIHCINKILRPTSGTVEINGQDIEKYTLKELAKIIGYVPCSSNDTFPLTVVDAVLLGRSPHSKWGSLDEDLAKVHDVLQMLGIEDLAMRPFNEISAGQHQKVMLARGIVQEPQILLLDEPTSNLDVKHQMMVTRLLRDFAHGSNTLVIMISHDLNIAAKYSDEVIMLHEGGVYAVGDPCDVITSSNIRHVYGVRSTAVMSHGRPHIVLEDEEDFDTGASSETDGRLCQTAEN